MKVHRHTQFCLICLLTFVFHQCHHCHEGEHSHNDCQISENERTEPEQSKEAEVKQKYYIEKLFNRYGENGKLSFCGLEKLMMSLGLGEIKIVEINHEDIGHDYVSYLDVLDTQEGKHSHSHNHPHSHNHTSSENQTANEGSSKRSQKCDPVTEVTEPSLKPDGRHAHDSNNHRHHKHHHRRHAHRHMDHNNTHQSHNDSIDTSDHGEPSHEPSTETNTTQEQPERKLRKHPKKWRKMKNREVSRATTQDFTLNHDSNEQYEHNHVHKHDHVHDVSFSHARFHEHNNDHSATHGHQDPNPASGDGYRHTSKREAPDKQISVGKHTNHKNHNEDEHSSEECLNVTQLLSHYGLHPSSPISPSLFTYLCPALLYQIDKRLCIEHYEDLHLEDLNKGNNVSLGNVEKTGASAWICGIISITVISLLSLLGVILIPIINQGCFKFLLTFLVALAVGTMSGDALLHLLPHSQGAHNHSHHEDQGHQHEHHHEHQHLHSHSHEHGGSVQNFLEKYDAVLKGLVALGGIYLLFIIEHCLRMYKHYKKQRTKQKWCKKKQKVDESPIGRKLSDHKLNRPDADWLQLKPLAGADDSVLSDDRLNETELTDLDGHLDSLPKAFQPSTTEEENRMLHSHNDLSHNAQSNNLSDVEYGSHHRDVKIIARKHNHLWPHKHSHHSHGHCHSGQDLKETGIANIAWMVIMGDGIHNFSDGLAIGAAFSAGLTGGISTSVAVFCHELPHELGDFAVLLKAGMTVKQAIVYNLLSAMMAYVGMLIGTAVGQYANNITLWIFAITAGMFLYVALVDMLPEMLHGDGDNEEHGYCPVGQFILQNLGLVLGFAIMLVIALYEDKIVLDIQF
ncbi:zinc transporter ZIP10 [Vipera latastei]